MPQVISFTRRQDRAAHSRSVRVRHPKENALSQGGTGQGIHQQTQPECSNDSLRGTTDATEQRIAELRTAMDAAAAAGDLQAYKDCQAEHTKALAMRLPATKARMDAKHSDFIEAVQTRGQHGYYLVPSAWLRTDERRIAQKGLRRATAFDDATPVDAEAKAGGAV